MFPRFDRFTWFGPALQASLLLSLVSLPEAHLNLGLHYFGLPPFEGPKSILLQIRDQGVLSPTARIACITSGRAFTERPLALYSQMYWGRDICTRYSNDFRDFTQKDFDWVIYLQVQEHDTISQSTGLTSEILGHLKFTAANGHFALYRVQK